MATHATTKPTPQKPKKVPIHLKLVVGAVAGALGTVNRLF